MGDISKTNTSIRPLVGAITKSVQCGEIVDVGEAVYIKSDSKAWLADADTADASKVRGIVTAIGAYGKKTSVAGDMVDVTFYGPVTGFSGLTPGQELFASTNPGAIEDTAPAGSSADFVWTVGFALAAGIVFVSPYSTDIAAQ